MRKQVTYICDICGAEYATEAECEACESRHVKVDSATLVYLHGGPMPTAVILEAADGTLTRYNWHQSDDDPGPIVLGNEHACPPVKLGGVTDNPAAPVLLKGLKAAMARAGIGQRELSRKTDIANSTLNGWIHERKKARPDRLPELAAALECTVAELINPPKVE